MHQQARLPEFFDQILQNTPVLGFGSRTLPPLQLKFRQILLGTLGFDFPETPLPLIEI